MPPQDFPLAMIAAGKGIDILKRATAGEYFQVGKRGCHHRFVKGAFLDEGMPRRWFAP
jgi:hypothetical protein